MIYMLISLIPFIYMGYFYFIKKKYNVSINFDLSYGMRCYCCKDKILTNEELLKNIVEDAKGLKLCDSCKRNEQLNKVFDKKSDSKFKRLLISDKYKRLSFIFLALMITCMAIDIFDKDNIRYFFLLGQVSQLSFWYILIKRWKYTSIKNPNHKIRVFGTDFGIVEHPPPYFSK